MRVNSGIYCILTSSIECVSGNPATSDTITMTVIPTYVISSVVEICNGQSYSFGGSIYSTAGTYSHTFVSVAGCDSVVTLTLTVNPVFITLSAVEVCDGGSYVFNGHIYTTAGNYNDTLTTLNGCDSIIVTQLTVNHVFITLSAVEVCNGDSYVFNGHIYTTAGNYNDTLTTVNGCDSIIVTQFTVNPVFVISSVVEICDGGSYIFNGNTYISAGTYYDTLTSVSGCDSIIVTNLTVNPNLPVSIAIYSSDTSICSGANVTFTATPTNGGTSPTYHWYLNGNTVGINSNTYSNNTLADSDEVYCVLLSSEECTVSNSDTSEAITINIEPGLPVSVSITASPPGPVCNGTEVTFEAVPVHGGDNPQYTWFINGILTGSGSSIIRPVSDNGDIILCIMTSNLSGCLTNNPDTATMVVQTYSLPIISFNTTNEKCLGAGDGAIQLTVTNGAPPYTYSWSNGQSSAIINSLQAGKYTVEVSDAHLCKSTKEIEVEAALDACLYIPNIFSPNSDGKNDKLYVRGSGIKYLEFTIYDRWGKEIFRSNEQSNGWDGCYDGTPMNAAVFVYTLKAEMISGNIVEEKGNVTLLR
ncbi:MAG: gliding motility-associated C-terminal domain-containing protein [Bacteroidia bacterium]|nr:gliding motility-associated C-terminal domain-containing protein [Bacteroidia bacterium]